MIIHAKLIVFKGQRQDTINISFKYQLITAIHFHLAYPLLFL